MTDHNVLFCSDKIIFKDDVYSRFPKMTMIGTLNKNHTYKILSDMGNVLVSYWAMTDRYLNKYTQYSGLPRCKNL